MKKKDRRTKWISLRVSPGEHKSIERAAEGCDSISSWARRVVLQAALWDVVPEATVAKEKL